jgi:hypothetical protein
MAAAARFLPAQTQRANTFPSRDLESRQDKIQSTSFPDDGSPNGKRDEILKANYQKNLTDARDLVDMAKSFEMELEKSDRLVLSLDQLKKLDNMDKITKRIRNRMQH